MVLIKHPHPHTITNAVGVLVMAGITLALTTLACGDKKEDGKSSGAPSSSAAASSAAPSAAAPSAAATPSASASLAPRADCPKGSTGPGTFDKPCEAKGKDRMMEAVWTGKTDDKGPYFKVTNKSPSVILYGKIAVYFYDKAGKQLEVPAKEGSKARPFQPCGGNIFGGVMKAGEKATMTFSCVKKDHVPENTAAIEAEMQQVGFSDASEKKSDLYWKNDDLAPDQRKKGAK